LEFALPMAFPAKHTSLGEILYIIQKLLIKKAPGHDLISNQIVKKLPYTRSVHKVPELSFLKIEKLHYCKCYYIKIK
jgi:hypothetical protein